MDLEEAEAEAEAEDFLAGDRDLGELVSSSLSGVFFDFLGDFEKKFIGKNLVVCRRSRVKPAPQMADVVGSIHAP